MNTATLASVPSRRAQAASRAGGEGLAVGIRRSRRRCIVALDGHRGERARRDAATGARAGPGRPSAGSPPAGRSTDRDGVMARAAAGGAAADGSRPAGRAARGPSRTGSPGTGSRAMIVRGAPAASRAVPRGAGRSSRIGRPSRPGRRRPPSGAARCPRRSCPTGRHTGSRRGGPPVRRRVPGAVRGPEVREHRPPCRPLHDLAGQGEVRGGCGAVRDRGCRDGGRSGSPGGSRRRDPAPQPRRPLDVDAGHEERGGHPFAHQDPVDRPERAGAPAVVEGEGHDPVRAVRGG